MMHTEARPRSQGREAMTDLAIRVTKVEEWMAKLGEGREEDATKLQGVKIATEADRDMMQQIMAGVSEHQGRLRVTETSLEGSHMKYKHLNGRLDCVDKTLKDHSTQLDAISDTLHE